MSEVLRRPWLARLPEGVFETLIRFPAPVLIAAALTLYNLDGFGAIGNVRLGEFRLAVNWAGALTFLWCAGAILAGEARRSPLAALGLQILGAAFFVWYFSVPEMLLTGQGADEPASAGPLPDPVYLTPDIVIGGLFISAAMPVIAGLAPYVTRAAEGDAVWQFTHKIWVAAVVAVIGALLLYWGAISVIYTVESLFELKNDQFNTNSQFYMNRIGSLSFFFALPLLLLTLVPRDTAELARKGADMEFSSRAVALLVKFIFVPLAWVFFFVLTAYCVKVLALGQFSEARLGQTSVIYGVCVVAVAALAYPSRDSGWFLALFWRAWPWLLVPSVALLIAALEVRLSIYGVTVPRYINVIAAIWLAALAVIFAVSCSRADIRLIPGLLALLLALAAFGPLSAVNLTGRSQTAILEDILTSRGLLKDGRWTGRAPDAVNWDVASRRTVWTAVYTLNDIGALKTVAPWFEQTASDPFKGDAKNTERLAAVQKTLNLPAYLPGNYAADLKYFNFMTKNPPVFAAAGPSIIVGPHTIYIHDTSSSFLERDAQGIGKVKVAQKDGELTVEANQSSARFDLKPEMRRMLEAPANDYGARTTTDADVIELTPVDGALKVKLAVHQISGRSQSGGAPALSSLTYVLILERP